MIDDRHHALHARLDPFDACAYVRVRMSVPMRVRMRVRASTHAPQRSAFNVYPFRACVTTACMPACSGGGHLYITIGWRGNAVDVPSM